MNEEYLAACVWPVYRTARTSAEEGRVGELTMKRYKGDSHAYAMRHLRGHLQQVYRRPELAEQFEAQFRERFDASRKEDSDG